MTSCLPQLAPLNIQRIALTHLSMLSSGLPFLKNRKAFVRWSFSITASCRSLPIKRFFSLTSFSNGKALRAPSERTQAQCSTPLPWPRLPGVAFVGPRSEPANSQPFHAILVCGLIAQVRIRCAGIDRRHKPSCISRNARCNPSTVNDWLSRSDAAFSYAS